MRRGRDGGVLADDTGKVLGFNLGADYCAEHEWGIKGLQSDFGIPFGDDTKLGIEKRTIQVRPFGLIFERKKGSALLYYVNHSWVRDAEERDRRLAESAKQAIDRGELTLYGDRKTATAWDEKSFGVYTKDIAAIPALVDLYEAFARMDVAIWLGGGGVFQNAGLVLGIVSRLPVDKVNGMRNADEDRIKLVERAKGTKIEETLTAAGKRWFALSPRWANKERDKTNYDVVFWLNPMEQRIHNYGSFTVEELRLWAENKGPVMMTKAQRVAQ